MAFSFLKLLKKEPSEADIVLADLKKKYRFVDIRLLRKLMCQELYMRSLSEKKKALEKEYAERSARCVALIKDIQLHEACERYTGSPEGWYEYIPDSYKNTVYRTRRVEIEYLVSGNLSENILKAMYITYFENPERSLLVRFVVHCDSVMPSPKGLCLIVSDPFGSIRLEPLESTCKPVNKDAIVNMIGKMLLIDVRMEVSERGIIYVPYSIAKWADSMY